MQSKELLKKNLANETLVVGLGISGLAVAHYFKKKHIPFTVLDSRENPPKLEELKQACPEVAIHTGGFPPALLSQAKTIILSPGLSQTDPSIQPYLSPSTKVIGDIELFAQDVTAKVVAITGSNGKSTVTTLVGEMAKQSGLRVGVGGNLGTPALSLLEENHDLYVLELSSFQLETTYSLQPAVSTVLNICLDHMDRYQTLEQYYNSKARIFHNCNATVVNRDDQFVLQRVPAQLPVISFGLNLPPENHFGVSFATKMLMHGATPILPLSELKLFGQHNVANVLAALSLGHSIQLPMQDMVTVLKTFTGLPHRGEWVRTRNHVQWINDSKGTNVGATQAALNGLKNSIPGKWVLIAGGIAKNADFTPLKTTVQESCRAVILIGEAKEELYQLLSKSISCIQVNSMEEAVLAASKYAKSGDGVLLSPACASFDMFSNFEHRGDMFKSCVRALT